MYTILKAKQLFCIQVKQLVKLDVEEKWTSLKTIPTWHLRKFCGYCKDFVLSFDDYYSLLWEVVREVVVSKLVWHIHICMNLFLLLFQNGQSTTEDGVTSAVKVGPSWLHLKTPFQMFGTVITDSFFQKHLESYIFQQILKHAAFTCYYCLSIQG